MAVLLCLGLPAALTFRPAYAASFTVNTTVDESDGKCNTDTLPDPVDCSLRDAIDAASSIAPFDTIEFDLIGPVLLTLGNISINKSVTIDGGASGAVLRNDFGRIFDISGGAVTLTHLTIQGSNGFGGGIVSSATGGSNGVTIDSVHFTNSRATNGGAIENTGTMTITGSLFDYSTADSSGGAIYNAGALSISGTRIEYNGAGSGATIFSSGTLIATSCLLASSTAGSGPGGGLYLAGGSASLTNCTVRDHKAEGPVGGGAGIAVDGGATLTLTNVTIAENVAATGGTALGGGGILNSGGSVTLRNTLVAGNTLTGGATSDLEGAVGSTGYNLIRSTPAGFTALTSDITGQNPLLGTPDVYGAPNGLQSYALLPGSPAIDAAACANGVTVDQRGIARAQTSAAGAGIQVCDIGAFESRGFSVAASGGTPQSADIGAAFATPLAATVTSLAAGEPVEGGALTITGPASGAGIAPASASTSIGAAGAVSASVTANTTRGAYLVTAGGRGVATPASFSLTNRGPVYSSMPAPGSTIDLGSAVVSTPVDTPALLSVSEAGELTLNVTNAVISGADAADFSVTPTSLSIADGGAAQNLSISCTPSVVAPRSATLTVSHNAGPDVTYTLTCAGTAAPTPSYGSTPAPSSTIDTGAALVGASTSTTLSVRESGTAALSITGAALSGPNAADFSVSPTTFTIADGAAAQTVTITCTPSAAGARSATLTVSHNASGSPATYALTCTGNAPVYASSPAAGSTITLPTALTGATVSATLTVSEAGSAPLSVTAVQLSGEAAADFSVSPTSFTIADGGAAREIVISCTPSVIGARSATLTVSHNAGAAASYTVVCTSEGRFLPVITR